MPPSQSASSRLRTISRKLTSSFQEVAADAKRLSPASSPDPVLLRNIDAMLDAYVREHGRRRRLDGEAECRSADGCVIAEYSCPERLGNRMHEFVNAMILALVTNRTLQWSYLGGATALNYSECPRVLTRAAWMGRAADAARGASSPPACRLDQVLAHGSPQRSVERRLGCHGAQLKPCPLGQVPDLP